MTEFLLPSLGADMDEAKLVRWLVKPGDSVRKGQIIAEVETDKAVLEVECWDEGVIEELVLAPGPARLRVGTVLARIRPAAGEERPLPPPVAPVVTAAAAVTPPEVPEPPPPIRHLAHELGVELSGLRGTGPGGAVTRDDVRKAARPKPAPGERVKASPHARRLAGELGVDLTGVVPTGPGEMITAEDVRMTAQSVGAVLEAGTPSVPSGDRAGEADEEPAQEAEASGKVEAGGKVEAMRRAIARSMAHSKREIPHYYLATRIDLGKAMRWLEEYNGQRSVTARILPAALLLKATALAVRETPDLNGHWIDDQFRPSESVHLGVAISLREGGLVAPAIHDADQLDLDEMMTRLRDLVNRARSWRLRSSEMSDPTITVTNLGDRGVETAFPIIVPPQVAMVGFGKVVATPVAVGGMIGVAPMVHATLSGDHRVTDGHRGGLLLMSLDRLLQKPEQL
ncbi:MAG TPA: dihydrolipoamide acetyltransferase family protein [Acidimicrobiia bacterium]|nr:dihydrolipoamide acetyltransferase family protein [Acidimicrobiia bacterium]